MTVTARFDEAVAHHREGRLAQARALYESILADHPAHFDSLHLLGVLAYQAADLPAALDLIGRAMALRPEAAAPHANLGLVLRAMDQPDRALASFDRAILLQSDHVEARFNRAALLHGLGRQEEAIAGYDEVVALRPDHVEAHNDRGNALSDMGRLNDALASYDRALAVRGDDAEAWNNRGNALARLMRADEALASYARAIVLRRDYAEAYYNQGNMLSDLKRFRESLDSYRKAAASNAGIPLLPGALLNSQMRICDWTGIEAEIEHYAARIEASALATAPFIALCLLDRPDLHRQAAQLYAAAQYPASDRLGPLIATGGKRKIRVGYYSADFHDHPTAYLIAEMIESHGDDFESFAFSFGPDRRDAMRLRLSAAFDEFIDVRGLGDDEIAILSREIGIDIAVDLKGYTNHARPGIFALRCAPVQISYLGYPGTMGADHIDYIVADDIVIPESRRMDFVEKVVTLPGCYMANDSRRAIAGRRFSRADLGLPDRAFVFCCLNNVQKILPPTFGAWMRILDAVDGSILWLFQDNEDMAANLRREAEARGVDGGRLRFAHPMPLDEHLARYRVADLFLDTWPYNAHTTASDALWAGLPVLTRAGSSFVSRVAASLLDALGLSELITHNGDDYEAMAIGLARDPDRLARIKQVLAEARTTTPLFDGKAFARKIEAAYRAIHARHRAGLAPESLDLSGRAAPRGF